MLLPIVGRGPVSHDFPEGICGRLGTILAERDQCACVWPGRKVAKNYAESFSSSNLASRPAPLSKVGFILGFEVSKPGCWPLLGRQQISGHLCASLAFSFNAFRPYPKHTLSLTIRWSEPSIPWSEPFFFHPHFTEEDTEPVGLTQGHRVRKLKKSRFSSGSQQLSASLCSSANNSIITDALTVKRDDICKVLKSYTHVRCSSCYN